MVNFNPRYTVPELSVQANDAGAEIMITLGLRGTFQRPRPCWMPAWSGASSLRLSEMLPEVKGSLFRMFKSAGRAPWHAGGGVVRCRDLQNDDGRSEPVAISVNDVAVFSMLGEPRARPKARCSPTPIFP